MEKYDWSRLTPLQIGRFAEYYVKMEFTLYGFDVYQAEVDDKGIDFIIRKEHDRYYDIQVKSALKSKYIFFFKQHFIPRENLLAAIAVFVPFKMHELFLIPLLVWQNPNTLFVSRDYASPNLKSRPEWGVSLSRKNYDLLAHYQFEKQVIIL